MKFSISFDIPKGPSLDYATSTLCIGSCFAVHMAKQLENGKFSVGLNPFGVIYNPISIKNALDHLDNGSLFKEQDIFSHKELWHSWMHHGAFSDVDKYVALDKMNRALDTSRKILNSARFLIITLGSAFVYEKNDSGDIVANCHKIPASQFRKRMLGVEEIVSQLGTSLEQIQKKYPKIQVILTVSPVRHIRDGVVENQRSKSTLLLACNQLCEKEQVHYFPSYEIMMDELRDYRFYGKDLVHPSESAIEYIWTRFMDTHFGNQTRIQYERVMKVVSGFQHRILHEGTNEHKKFLVGQISKARNLMDELPVDFTNEINRAEEELKGF